MELRQIEKGDYKLILQLDAKVYPVSEENKIKPEIIDKWYNTYPKYGMIYTNNNKIVAMTIAIPMPINIWYKLIKGECFENTLNIQWEQSNNDKNGNKVNINIGIHIYHIEVLNRDIVGKGFYKHMLQDLNSISKNYHHNIEGLSGYCVTPKGNRLFIDILKCKNAEDFRNSNDKNYNKNENNKKEMSEFIVQDNINGEIKIVECSCDTDIKQPYFENNIQPPKSYKFISKCNMLYTIRKEPNDSPVWEYLKT